MQGEVRRSQLITTYGVGAIVAVEDESFMVAGIDRWPVRSPNLHEPRLERVLHVSGFAVPPATDGGQDIPVVRFPRMVWCPVCKRIEDHDFLTTPDRNKCHSCNVPLVPSRFVICCEKGHISDFPYFAWVHAGEKPKSVKHELSMEMGGKTASLRDIRISCSCGLEKTLEGAFHKHAMRGVARCKGWRPWLTEGEGECDQTPRTLQRGASNVWFSITHSAISIPPWSEGAYRVLNRQWSVLKHVPDDALGPTIEGMDLASGTAYGVDELVEAVKQRRSGTGDRVRMTTQRLREQEYDALCRGREEVSRDQEFVCVGADRIPDMARRRFDQVMLVKRLREVRVLESFSRVVPPGNSEVVAKPPIYDRNPGWLPAIEVTGEGVFLRLAEDELRGWENREAVRSRAERVDRSHRRRFESLGLEPDRAITPRFILIHSLAHVLINQWALDSGYPAGSLRERLYVSPSMAGLLIYTATTDSAGSLGGVIAQAEPARLERTLTEAMISAAWCSADPLCIESEGAGVDSLSLAACHACILLPEVSCEERNLFLDRGTLIGIPEAPDLGFFAQPKTRG